MLSLPPQKILVQNKNLVSHSDTIRHPTSQLYVQTQALVNAPKYHLQHVQIQEHEMQQNIIYKMFAFEKTHARSPIFIEKGSCTQENSHWISPYLYRSHREETSTRTDYNPGCI